MYHYIVEHLKLVFYTAILSNLSVSRDTPQLVANNEWCIYVHDSKHATILSYCSSCSDTHTSDKSYEFIAFFKKLKITYRYFRIQS